MREQRYFTGRDGLARIKRVVNRYRTTDEPDDIHDQAARYLCEVLEKMSVYSDLDFATALITDWLHKSRLCKKQPVGNGTKSLFDINDAVLAHAFRATAAKRKRN